MSGRVIEIPDRVRNQATLHGSEGERWLADLGALVEEIEVLWDVAVGPTLHGGCAGLVALATRADGVEVVVKLLMPDGPERPDTFAHERLHLLLADGRGCARLLAHDIDRRALLLERLGRPLNSLGLSTNDQIAIICATLQTEWAAPVGGDTGLPTGAEKARWLSAFIVEMWRELGRPCSEAAVDRAVGYAQSRADAFDPETSVLVHGDAHNANTLEVLDSGSNRGSGFKFVDPDGLFAERACDLAVPMREFNEELVAGDTVALGQERCRFLSALTGVDRRSIWEWGFVERMSSGLHLMQLGEERWGQEFLDVADVLVTVDV